MDLSDALDDWPSGGNQSTGSGMWSGNNQPTNPTWPGGQPQTNPTWPGQPSGGGPTWPGQPSGGGPTWPGQPSGGGSPWPGQPSQPSGPSGGGWSNPAPGPAHPTAPQRNLSVPYYHQLQNGMHDNLLITIVGTVSHNPNKITVDLTAGNDFAFHFNPRFNENGHKVIVRNSCVGDKWGKEEREIPNFPFVPGQRFELKILCTNKEFRVAVNNNHLLEFKHRLPNLRAINRLSVYNDVTLHDVQVTRLS